MPMDMKLKMRLFENLFAVQERMRAACERAGRAPHGEVEIVAVTKTVSVEVARAASDRGLHHLGESRPQELWRKAAAIDRAVWWHLIGHLQRNKVERTLPLVTLIQLGNDPCAPSAPSDAGVPIHRPR